MKCILSVLLLAVCASKLISAIPLRNGMVFYQSQPDYYNSHRAFVMQYASQPARTYRRRNGEPANVNGVSAFVAGKKIATGTYVKQNYDDQELPEINGVATSIAQAYPEAREDEEFEADEAEVEEKPAVVPQNDEAPEEEPVTAITISKKKKSQPKPVEEEAEDDDEDEEEEEQRVYKRNRSQGGAPIYFPVSFGKTNGGAIAVANSYSTGKGGSATSHATAYGSPSKKASTKARKSLNKN